MSRVRLSTSPRCELVLGRCWDREGWKSRCIQIEKESHGHYDGKREEGINGKEDAMCARDRERIKRKPKACLDL